LNKIDSPVTIHSRFSVCALRPFTSARREIPTPASVFPAPPLPPYAVKLFGSILQFRQSAVKFQTPLPSVDMNFQPPPVFVALPPHVPPDSVRRDVPALVSVRCEFLVPASVEHILPLPPALPTHQTFVKPQLIHINAMIIV
ncbi:myb domain protein 33, partial [Striga asiatica]